MEMERLSARGGGGCQGNERADDLSHHARVNAHAGFFHPSQSRVDADGAHRAHAGVSVPGSHGCGHASGFH